jgi:hypothetical protein
MSEQSPTPTTREWVGEIDSWRVVGNRLITYDLGDMAVRGEVLVGPCTVIGGHAFFPPGVCSYLPEDSTERHTSEGWRHGIWKKRQAHEIINHEQNGYLIEGDLDHVVWLTGRERPKVLINLSIDEVMEDLESITPPNQIITDFMKTQMIKQGASVWAMLDQKSDKLHSDGLRTELKELQISAAGAFGNDWVLDNLVFNRNSSDG